MKEKEFSGGLKIFTLPKFGWSVIFPLLFVLTIFLWLGAILFCFKAKMLCYCLCICLLIPCWFFSFRRRGRMSTARITKSVNSCYPFQSTTTTKYNKRLVYFTLLFILLECTTSNKSRSSTTYSSPFINTIIVDAVDLNKSIDNPHRVMSNFKNENEDDLIHGKYLTLYFFDNSPIY